MPHNSANIMLIGVNLGEGGLVNLEKTIRLIPQERILQIVGDEYGIGFLSTCNRFEIYLITHEYLLPAIGSRLKSLFNSLGIWDRSLYMLTGEEAVRHLVRVASGLSSIAVGESEILEQVRNAKVYGRGEFLQIALSLFKDAYSSGKRVREEAEIDGTNSLGKLAVKLLLNLGLSKSDSILVVGYGVVGKRVVNELHQAGFEDVSVITRSIEKVSGRVSGVKIFRIDELSSLLNTADAVIVATSSPDYIIDTGKIASLSRDRRLVIIDLTVPRNVNPEIKHHFNHIIHLYNIEDLIPLARREPLSPGKIRRAEEIIEEETIRLFRKVKLYEVENVVRAIRIWAEEIRREELTKTLQLLTGDFNHDKEVIEILSRRLVNKLLHTPTSAIRRMAYNGNSNGYLELVKEIFGLRSNGGN